MKVLSQWVCLLSEVYVNIQTRVSMDLHPCVYVCVCTCV